MTRNIISKFKSYISCIFNKQPNLPQTPLGRWNLKHDCKLKEMRTVFWANSDHCGDTLCGNVEKSKDILDAKIKSNQSK